LEEMLFFPFAVPPKRVALLSVKAVPAEKDNSVLVKIELPAGFCEIEEKSPPKEEKAPLIPLKRAVPESSSIE